MSEAHGPVTGRRVDAAGAAGAVPHRPELRELEPLRSHELDVDDRRLVLSDLLNRVLDRGLAVTGSVTLAVADIDLVRLDLSLVLTAVETAFRDSSDVPRP
jgi:hypothetical protein